MDALRWLESNDPDYVLLGDDKYGAEHGIATRMRANRTRKYETVYSQRASDITEHCGRCARTAAARANPVL